MLLLIFSKKKERFLAVMDDKFRRENNIYYWAVNKINELGVGWKLTLISDCGELIELLYEKETEHEECLMGELKKRIVG